MIEVLVNQKNKQVKENTDLESLLNDLEISSKGIAVAVNQRIIKKEDWVSFHLSAQDSVLIIKATQGG